MYFIRKSERVRILLNTKFVFFLCKFSLKLKIFQFCISLSLIIFRDLEPSKTCMIKINLVLKFEKYGKNLRHNLYVYFSKYAKPQRF